MGANNRWKGLCKTRSSIIPVKALLVVCLLTNLLLGVYCSKGRLPDFALFKKSGRIINLAIRIVADAGFRGINKIHQTSILPFKKSQLKPLTKPEKQSNSSLARQRVVCEQRNRECKIFRIVKEVYRGKHKTMA